MTELILGVGAIVLIVILIVIAMFLAFKVVIENNETIVHHKAKNGDVRLDEIAGHYLKLTNLESCNKN